MIEDSPRAAASYAAGMEHLHVDEPRHQEHHGQDEQTSRTSRTRRWNVTPAHAPRRPAALTRGRWLRVGDLRGRGLEVRPRPPGLDGAGDRGRMGRAGRVGRTGCGSGARAQMNVESSWSWRRRRRDRRRRRALYRRRCGTSASRASGARTAGCARSPAGAGSRMCRSGRSGRRRSRSRSRSHLGRGQWRRQGHVGKLDHVCRAHHVELPDGGGHDPRRRLEP